MEQFHGTTIISVRRGNEVAVGGDGQVTLGNIIIKGTARKIRRLYHDKILAGFAGATADAFTLQERWTMVFNTECQLVQDPRGAEREAMNRLPAFRPGSAINYR